MGIVLLMPGRLVMATKRCLTSASVTLLLIMLMGLNIIWGYPWTGMLAATIACIVIGLFANWMTRAKLLVNCTLPTHVPLGHPFRVTTYLNCINRVPSVDTLIAWPLPEKIKPESKLKRKSKRSPPFQLPLYETSEPEFFSLLRAGEPVAYVSSMKFHRRGIFPLPRLMVQSTFPFYLFRYTSYLDVNSTIAVTPVPLHGERDQDARQIMASVGDWARQLLMGDASEYSGSREYVTGMSVRRWDFASWARLGRPIVREFRTPAVRSMNLIVDTSVVTGSDHDEIDSYDESFETLMSATVSVLDLLSTSSVGVELFLADESMEDYQFNEHDSNDPPNTQGTGVPVRQLGNPQPSNQQSGNPQSGNQRDRQLVRLAMSHAVDRATANRNIEQAIAMVGREPTLLLTRRPESEFSQFGNEVTVVRIDSALSDSANGQAPPSSFDQSSQSAGQANVSAVRGGGTSNRMEVA